MAGRLRSPVAAPAAPDALVGITEGEVLPILLVDDRVENLRALESVLEGLEVPLESVTSGEEALRRLLVRDYALILLDVRMPGLDGLQTAELIKGRDRSREVPIVFLTAARDEIDEILRGYGVGAIDYVLKPFDPELLRSKVSVFVELERNRRMLKRSEAFLRGAFEAAPIGKTVLDGARRIVRANPAFGRLLGREPASLIGVAVDSLCQEEDRALLLDALAGIAGGAAGAPEAAQASADVRLLASPGTELWVGAVASSIDPAELADPLLLVQWIDLSSRRRAERARAELLLEHSARTNAEAIAERLDKLQTLSAGIDSLALGEVLPELAVRLAELFEAELAEVEVAVPEADPIIVRAAGGRVLDGVDAPQAPADGRTEEVPIVIEHAHGRPPETGLSRRPRLHRCRPLAAGRRRRTCGAGDPPRAAARARAQHRRRAPAWPRAQATPQLDGLRIAAFYQAAGDGVEVGGDWYDAFELDKIVSESSSATWPGRGIPAASGDGAAAQRDACFRARGRRPDARPGRS